MVFDVQYLPVEVVIHVQNADPFSVINRIAHENYFSGKRMDWRRQA